MAKLKMTAAVTSQVQLAEGIYDLRLAAGEIAAQAVPGQFVSLYSKDGSRLLPRPISLCGIDKEKGELRLVYRVAGAGTKEFSALAAGDTIDVLGCIEMVSIIKESIPHWRWYWYSSNAPACKSVK